MNSWNGLGRLTKDPELRYTPAGKAICHFSIAVTRNKEESDFFECEAWEKTGETISNHVKKGQRILIDGRLQQDRWDDAQTHEKRSKVKIVVNRFDFIEPANQDAGAQQGQGQVQGQGQRQGQAPNTPPQQPPYPGPYGQPPTQPPYGQQPPYPGTQWQAQGQPPTQGYPQNPPGFMPPPPSYGQSSVYPQTPPPQRPGGNGVPPQNPGAFNTSQLGRQISLNDDDIPF